MQYDGYNSAFETTCCFSGHIVYSETGVIDTCLSPNELGIYTKQNSRGMMMYPAGENITAVSLFGTDEFKRALPLALTEARSKNIETAQLTDWLMEPKKNGTPAYAVGYANVSHFLQAFRKFYGKSPRDTVVRKESSSHNRSEF